MFNFSKTHSLHTDMSKYVDIEKDDKNQTN